MSDHVDRLFEAEASRIDVPRADPRVVMDRGRSLLFRRRAAIGAGGIFLLLAAALIVPKMDLFTRADSVSPARGDRTRLKDQVTLSIETLDPFPDDGGTYQVLVIFKDLQAVCFLMPAWVEEAAIYNAAGHEVAAVPNDTMELRRGDVNSTACDRTDESLNESIVLQAESHSLEMFGGGRTLVAGLAFESADDIEPSSVDETELLEYQATEALDAGDLAAAQGLGQRRLDTAPSSDNWDHGNAIHYGHLILGHVALRRGDVALAKTELIRAGHTEGSPQLNSFGPNMSLARDLLTIGEEEVVIEYIELLKNFYPYSDELNGWIDAIKAGAEPGWDRYLGGSYLDPEPFVAD